VVLPNQSILIHNLRNPSAKRDLLTEEPMELLTSPLDLAGYKNAIPEAIMRGTARIFTARTPRETRRARER
jgi:hypothetical protein